MWMIHRVSDPSQSQMVGSVEVAPATQGLPHGVTPRGGEGANRVPERCAPIWTGGV
jgi:hypothetical protein